MASRAADEGRAPVIWERDGFLYPHGGARIGPAWGYAWNRIFGKPEEVLRADAVAAVALHCDLQAGTVQETLRQATKAGLLVVTRRLRGRARVPYLMRADWYYAANPQARPKGWALPPEPWPEYAVHAE